MASAGGDSGETLSLNLMPMLDIFSILVTFLLMSYSTDPTTHDVDSNLELPDSVTLVTMDEVPSIVVNRNEILVNNKKLVTLENGKVPAADLAQGAIMPVFKALKEISDVNKKAIEEFRRDTSPDDKKAKPGEITIEMDKKHDFQLLKRIMLSGQQAEFVTFKLLVAKESI
ncbi:MAG: biopolymer transporter ExbD [Chitinophagaceae bacterium]|nr:biopolymer transporter ExbD [Oligoflexus sp.]